MDKGPNRFYKIIHPVSGKTPEASAVPPSAERAANGVHADPPRLVPQHLADIGAENFGAPCSRPLVLFSDPQEAMEKSLWFYAHNILPLIGEPNNLPITLFAAKRYGIDAIVGEPSLVTAFLPSLAAEYDLRRIASLTLISEHFTMSDVTPLLGGGRVRLVLVHPAVGSFAESCAERLDAGELAFHPDPAGELFTKRGTLVVRKQNSPLGPFRRVGTELSVRRIQNVCACPAAVSFEIIPRAAALQP